MKTSLSTSPAAFAINYVMFGFEEGDLKILLIKHQTELEDHWALPLSLIVEPYTSIEEAAQQGVYKLTGLSDIYMEQFYTFTDPDVWPEYHMLTVTYFAMLRIKDAKEAKLIASYTRNAVWISTKELGDITFKQLTLFQKVLKKVRHKILYHPVAFELLPEKFTLVQLQHLYEAILNKKLDKGNFRKKIKSYGILSDLNEKQKDASSRAAKLFKLNKKI